MNNVGTAIMCKMGWKQGTGLGQSAQGRTKPISLRRHNFNDGIGYDPRAVRTCAYTTSGRILDRSKTTEFVQNQSEVSTSDQVPAARETEEQGQL